MANVNWLLVHNKCRYVPNSARTDVHGILVSCEIELVHVDVPLSLLRRHFHSLWLLFNIIATAAGWLMANAPAQHLRTPFTHVCTWVGTGHCAKMTGKFIITSCVRNHLPNSASNVDYAKNYCNQILWTSENGKEGNKIWIRICAAGILDWLYSLD